MNNITYEKYYAQANEKFKELDFSRETINERLHRLLYEPLPGMEEEFWENLKPSILNGIKKQIENWLEMEASLAVGGYMPYEHSEERITHRSGHYTRELQTTVGNIKNVKVPKVRKKKGGKRGWAILRAYKKHRIVIDDLVKEVFLGGVSTRRAHEVLKPVLGKQYSAQMVSISLKKLDKEVKAWHRRQLSDDWNYLIFDAINIKLRSGGKVRKKSILVVKGFVINEKGSIIREEIIDYLPARKGESTSSWESFVNDLYMRGLEGKNLKMIVTDGNKGLLNALDLVYPRINKQRCWQHKMRNVANKCRKKYQSLIVDSARKIYKAESKNLAIKAFHDFKKLCNPIEPEAVDCIEKDLPELLYFYDEPIGLWKKLRTTNIIERTFREVRRRIRTISVFSNESSVDRIIYGVLARLNENWRKRSEKFAKKY